MSKVFREVLYCEIDDSKLYRYVLEVLVSREKEDKTLVVILKNPSTADETTTDSTTNHVEAWARYNGFTKVVYLNLFGIRSKYPKALNDFEYNHIVGPENDFRLKRFVNSQDTVIIAWGTPSKINKKVYNQRIKEVRSILRLRKVIPFVIHGISIDGYPLHGMRWARHFPIYKASVLEDAKNIDLQLPSDYWLHEDVMNEDLMNEK